MIVASILLIAVAVVFLVTGLAGGSSSLLTVSIAASLLAAVALVAGARQAAANRAAADRPTGPRRGTRSGAPVAEGNPYGPSVAGGVPYGPPPGEGTAYGPDIPVQHLSTTAGTGGTGWRQPPEPPVADPFAPPGPRSPAAADPDLDEPAAQHVPVADAARVARLRAEVRVVDGHPRYHLADCPYLVGRDDEPLPVAEAVELGFTPCAYCTPDTVLLADARPD